MMTLETESAAVRTQTARSALARGPEHLPFTGAIDRPPRAVPAILDPRCADVPQALGRARLRIIAPVILGAFPSASSLVLRLGL